MTHVPIFVWLAKVLAILGGIVLVAITILTCISIVGRSLVPFGLAPIPGDFELVEIGTGFAVFAFLPWCQLLRAHATVDLFTNFLSPRVNRVIDLISELLMTGVIVLIAWRLSVGMMEKMRYGETTFILQFPVWWGFAAALAAAVVAVVVSFYMLWVRIREVVAGRTLLEPGQGAIH